MKENFTTKLIKRFYGITGPLDECKRREVDRIGNVCFVYFFPLVALLSLLALLLAKHHAQLVAYALPYALFFLSFCVLVYLTSQVASSDLNQFDKEELTDSDKKTLATSSWQIFLCTFLWMYAGAVIGDLFALAGSLLDRASHPKTIFFALFSGVLFTGMAKLLAKQKKGE